VWNRLRELSQLSLYQLGILLRGQVGTICGTLIHQPIRRLNPHTLRLRKRTRGNLLTNQEVGGIGDDRSILWVF
jgi:hypothetical protein